MSKTSVVLGFSAGMDSMAATRMLQDSGYDVTALTIDMIGDEQLLDRARISAENIGVNFDIYNCQDLFKRQIVDYFTSEYIKGRTPAPCTRCNPLIKWRSLLNYADTHSIDHIATGHYFRKVDHNNKYYVARAKDSRKDQSYYLWGLTQQVLERALTPMAETVKEDIKRASALKSESMGVCFLGSMHYAEFITHTCGQQPAGEIVDCNGDVVGNHCGIANYTIGQKRGEGIPKGCGLAVVGIDAAHNRVVLGENEKLLYHNLYIESANIVCEEELLDAADITVMVRGIGRNPEGYAKATRSHDGYVISVDDPAWAPALGQPVVLYRQERVIGGGYLEKVW